MKKNLRGIIVLAGIIAFTSCKKDKEDIATAEVHTEYNPVPLDSTRIDAFFAEHKDFKEFQPEVEELYKKHNYHYIWHDKKGLIEFAEVLYDRANQLTAEGLPAKLPYEQRLGEIFHGRGTDKPELNDELMISSMYFYWVHKVYKGLDIQESKETGWYLPRERVSYVSYLDTLMRDPEKIKGDKNEMFAQYFNLRKALQKYREIEKKGGWGTIDMGEGVKAIKPGDSSPAVAQVRKRLFMEGYIANDSGKNVFDAELAEGLASYAKRHNEVPGKNITPAIVKDLNTPVSERIKTLSVNMERCRWVAPEMNTSPEFIAVNIPSFWLQYIREGKEVLSSRVVVGKELNKTVVFSGKMSYLVFSPYWNVPPSILKNEIKPELARNPNYLAEHNMEWEGDRVRQRPGGNNSLGLVKFMFPNSNNIYLHDTPAKSLFSRDERAFSHGCVRVQKARELAIAITKKDGGWSEAKVDAAMNKGTENSYVLKKKIPVYIAYFTAWADENGNVAFFDDVYSRDQRLAQMLYKS